MSYVERLQNYIDEEKKKGLVSFNVFRTKADCTDEQLAKDCLAMHQAVLDGKCTKILEVTSKGKIV